MARTTFLQQCKFLTLSFSGAGHLLPYHLGVASALRAKGTRGLLAKPIRAASGSSSGAVAATAFVYFTHDQILAYADRFISDGGRAMHHLKAMIDEHTKPPTRESEIEHNNISLHIAATRCSDGSLHLFDFPSTLPLRPPQKDHLAKCLEASCRIPQSFHPSDVLQRRWASSSISYPENDGILIDGISYVDGGISAPAPPTPVDSMEGACRIVISPIAGSNQESNAMRISPKDVSWKFPLDVKCRGGFAVHPSVQNLKAMQTAVGFASPTVIKEWFERGVEDTKRMLAM